MPITKIAWSLAALCLVLLGIGAGEYFQLSSSSSPRSSSVAVTPAVPPSQAASAPQPTVPGPSVPHGGQIARTSPIATPTPVQTVPLSHGRFPGTGVTARSNPVSHRTPAPASKPATVPSATSVHSGTAARTPTVPLTRGAHSDNAHLGTGTEKSPRLSGHAGTLGRHADREYLVQPGDTLWDLAAIHLGSPYRWTELFDLNRGRAEPGGEFVDPNLVYAGWTLRLPQAGGIVPQKKVPELDPVYVVQPGDTLWDLAATHLGSAYRWTELFDLNRGRAEPGGRLTDPNVIYAGWTLKFPLGAAGIRSLAAPEHSVASKGQASAPAQVVMAVGGPRPGSGKAAGDSTGWSI